MNNIVRNLKGKLLLCSGLLAASLFTLHPAFTTPARAADLFVLGGGGGGGAGSNLLGAGTGGAGGVGGASQGGAGAGGTSPLSAVGEGGAGGGAWQGDIVGTGTPNGTGTYSENIRGADGGSAAVSISTEGNASVNVYVSGGQGGQQGYTSTANGGAGGAAGLTITNGASLSASGATIITGGAGGTGGAGTNAGVGGNATFTVDGTFASTAGIPGLDPHGIKITAGADNTVAGGNAELYATNRGTVISNTGILVQNVSGSSDTTATLDIQGTLAMRDDRTLNNPLYPILPGTPNAPIFLDITAIEHSTGGDVSIHINKLDARYANVNLDPTNENSAFRVGTAVVSNGWHPTGNILRLDNEASPSPSAFRVDNVQVLGKGRLELTDGESFDPLTGDAAIGYLDAHGAGLSILSQAYFEDAYADGHGTPNGAHIAVVERADITRTALSVDDRNGQLGMNKRSDIAILLETTEDNGLQASTKHYRTQSYMHDRYSLEVRDANRVELTLTSEVLKVYAEARAASLAFLNQGSDLLLSQGFGSALAATSAPGWQAGTFGAVSGGWSRYDTGSHVDVSGVSMLAGFGMGNDAGPGRWTGAVFFEAGWGSYNTYNSFSNGDVDGDGGTEYYGGGLLGRYDFTSGTFNGLYADLAARVGNTSTDFNTNDIKYTSSVSNRFLGDADFDIDSTYYGLMAGVGYQWNVTEKGKLDFSTHLLWNHQESDSTNVHFDHVSFDDADSLRTRVGGRFSYDVSDDFSPYAGAYWDYEFDGETKAKVNGWKVDSPDLEGSTGVGELGLTIKPVADSAFSMDLGVQGYTGVRQGLTGSLQLKYEF